MRRGERKKKRERQRILRDISKHHVLPRSRGGTPKTNEYGENIAYICPECHKHYHNELEFSNMRPDEIIAFLVRYYWNSQWEWVEKALTDKLLYRYRKG